MRSATSPIDLGFIREVYRTSAWVYAVTGVLVLGYAGTSAWIGLSAGAALAIGSLWLIEWSVTRFVGATMTTEGRTAHKSGPPSVLGRSALVVVGGGKYLLLGLAVAGVVGLSKSGSLNLIAFVGGIALIHAVIVLKAVGAWLFPESAR